MPKKTLFRSLLNYENGKSSSTVNKESNEPPSVPSPSLGTAAASWTEAALEKANMAVLYDFTGSPKQALDAYNEAIRLLDKVFEVAMQDGTDQSRLKKIYDSYIDRVSILTQQINNHELDATPTISIPIAQSPTHRPFQAEKQSPPPNWNLNDYPTNLDSKTPPPPPPPIPNQSSKAQLPPLPPLPKSTKSHKTPPPLPPPKSPSGSLFGSMFLKMNASKENIKSSSANNHSIFSMPAPSKSTPTLSSSRSTKSWKKYSSNKKKQRHSTELESLDASPFTFNSSKLDLPSLTLPDVDIPKDDDYFDLQSTAETKHLLYSTSSEQQQEPFTSLMDLHRIDNNNELDKYGNDSGNHMVHKGYSSHENTTENSNNESQQPVTTATQTITRSPSSSSTFSGNISTKHYQPYTTPSTRNSSIYSPTRSSIYSTSTWADDYSITSSKQLPPQPSLLFLPEFNPANHSTASFFTDSTDFAIDDLTKFLADSAATMPDRSHQHHHQRANVGPSIAAVVEEEPHELSSAPTPQLDAKQQQQQHQQQQQQSHLLARSPSSKSTASSFSSSHSANAASTIEQPTPLPSNSSKSISFWNKRNNNNKSSSTTKPKIFKTLAPLRTDHQHSKPMDDTRRQGSHSLPTTPRSIATNIGQSFLSPTTPSKRPNNNNNSNHNSSTSTMPHHFFGVDSATSMMNKGIDVQHVFESTPNNKDNKQPKLMARLLQSMEEGGYITDRIHAPKQLWYQTQVRLPAIDAKITSCEQLLTLLQRMHTRTRHLDVMTTDALHDLGRLEHALDQIKHSFGKSQSHDPLPPPTPQTSHSSSLLPASSSSAYQPSSSALTTQEQQQNQHSMHSNNNNNRTVATWSSKWSKSVERIRMDTKSSEEQIHAYISTLIRLFSMASVLDEWRDILMDMSRATAMDVSYLYDHLLQKTMMCTGTLHTVVCSFVMQDFAILMNKWLKRHRDWILDD